MSQMDMKEIAKALKAFSILFVVLAVLNIVLLIGAYAAGQINMNFGSASTTEIVELVIAALVIILELVMGLNGIRQANGRPTGMVHVSAAKIAAVFMAIDLIMEVMNMTTGQKDLVGFLTSAVALLILMYFIKYAKALMPSA